MANEIKNVVKINYLTPENAQFYKTGDFIGLRMKNEQGEFCEQGRVYLHRLFPFTELWTNISVMTKESEELGIVEQLSSFEGTEAYELLKSELELKYFVPKIQSIEMLKEKFGFSNWKVTTDVGPISFTVRDTFRSMIRIGESRIYVLDNDGNRYEIEDYNKLDKKSYKKIELFI